MKKGLVINCSPVKNGATAEIVNEFDEADVIVSVAPSYWADIPGQYKEHVEPRKQEIIEFCQKM